jgi:NAD(P)-dependent dehydrogenase (short-subunit alcohol dehydrogenase family)
MKRKALVIGAGSGMGLATARILAADHDMVVADVSQQGADRAAAETGGRGTVLDITDRAALEALAAETGPIDALVITAGLSMSMADFDRVMAVNLGGTANALDIFLPSLNAGGAAVCMASIAGHLTTGLVPEVLAVIDDPLRIPTCPCGPRRRCRRNSAYRAWPMACRRSR